MKHQGAQGSVVGVGQAVDDGVERVSSNNLVFVFCKYMVSKINRSKQAKVPWILGYDVLAALIKLLWCSVVNKGSGRSRKNCFNRPVTLLTS